MAVIFALSSVARPPVDVGGWRGVGGHFVLFAILAVLIARALAGGSLAQATGRQLAAAVIATVLYGISDELHQAFVPPRTPEAMDVLTDAAGAVVAAVAIKAWGIMMAPRGGSRGSHRTE
jgi:VanZ family protein